MLGKRYITVDIVGNISVFVLCSEANSGPTDDCIVLRCTCSYVYSITERRIPIVGPMSPC